MNYLYIYIDTETKQLQYYDLSNNGVVALDKRNVPSNDTIKYFGVTFLFLILVLVRKFNYFFSLNISLPMFIVLSFLSSLLGFLFQAYNMNKIQRTQILPNIKQNILSSFTIIANMNRQLNQGLKVILVCFASMLSFIFLFFKIENILCLFGLLIVVFFCGTILFSTILVYLNKKKLLKYWEERHE